MDGHFITVVPDRFAFIAAEGGEGNLYVSGAALADLPDIPRRGDRVRFKVMTMKDGRRRAIDLVFMKGPVPMTATEKPPPQISQFEVNP